MRKFSTCTIVLLSVCLASGCSTWFGLGQFDSPEQRAWEEATMKMAVSYFTLPKNMSRVEKVEAIIAVGEDYVQRWYPGYDGYLALTEILAAGYVDEYLGENSGYKPRLRFIYAMVMEFLKARDSNVPADYDTPALRALERKASLDSTGAPVIVSSN